MIELFKNWINTLLMLGIFITILQLVIPNTNLKKYVNSLIGIVVIVTIISPVYDIFKNGNLEENLNLVLANMDSVKPENTVKVNDNIQNKLLVNSMQDKIKENIEEKLKNEDIVASNIRVDVSEKYEISSIEIIFNEKLDNTKKEKINKIVKNIKEEYEIEYSKISVLEE